jgi:tetratricopeptide (TPR) repeat protein
MKCLEKDRTRRYETANGLAADIERHLAGEPVLAAPPSAAYRVRKFIRRHRLGVMSGGAIAATLLVGAGMTTYGLLEARHERDVAQSKEAKATAVTQLLEDMLRSADVHNLKGPDYKVRQLLDEFTQKLGDQLHDQPEVEAAIRVIVSEGYASIGGNARAAEHLEAALEIRRRTLAPSDPLLATTLASYATMLHQKQDYVGATKAAEEALAILRETYHGDHASIAGALAQLGDLRNHADDSAEAERLLRQALEMQRRLGVDTSTTLGWLGAVYSRRHEFAKAEALDREALELRIQKFGREHVDVAATMKSLAHTLQGQHRYEEAESLLREAIAIDRKYIGSDNGVIADNLVDLAKLLRLKGDLIAAEAPIRDAIVIGRRLGDREVDVASHLNVLGAVLTERGEHEAAAESFEQALATLETNGVEGEARGTVLQNLGGTLRMLGSHDAAERRLREALAMRRELHGDSDARVARTLNSLGQVLSDKEDYPASEEMHRACLVMRRELFGEKHADVAQSLHNLGFALRHQERYDEAEACMRAALAMRRELVGDQHEDVAVTARELALLLEDADGDFDERERLLCEALAVERKLRSPQDPEIALYAFDLARLLMDESRFDEADELFVECLAIRERAFPTGHRKVGLRFLTMCMLGETRRRSADAVVATDPATATALLANAEPLLVDGCRGMLDDAGMPAERVREALERTAMLYELQERLDPGRGYAAKAAEWRGKLESLNSSIDGATPGPSP